MTPKDIHGVEIKEGDPVMAWNEKSKPVKPVITRFVDFASGKTFYCSNSCSYIFVEKFRPVVLPPDLPKHGEKVIPKQLHAEVSGDYSFDQYCPFDFMGLRYCCLNIDTGEKQFFTGVKRIPRTPTREDVFKEVYAWDGDRPKDLKPSILTQVFPERHRFRFAITAKKDFEQSRYSVIQCFEHAELVRE